MNILDEKSFAKANYDRLAKNIPTRLAAREDGFEKLIENSKSNPFKKLETLYAFMGEMSELVTKFTPCKKGCSYCCYYPVSISDVEIEYIEKHTRIKRRKEYLPKSDFHGAPCPFLKNGCCSIYESRPFVCRKHVALTRDNTWCKPENANDETFPILSFSGIDGAFHRIRHEGASDDVFDIRQVFGMGDQKHR